MQILLLWHYTMWVCLFLSKLKVPRKEDTNGQCLAIKVKDLELITRIFMSFFKNFLFKVYDKHFDNIPARV